MTVSEPTRTRLSYDPIRPGATITGMVNNYTATTVRLTPPYRIHPHLTAEGAREEYEDFERRFDAFCRAAWELGHIDPAEITAIAGWQRWDPRDKPEGEPAADG